MRNGEKREERKGTQNNFILFWWAVIIDVQESVAVQIKFCFSSRRDFEGIGWENIVKRHKVIKEQSVEWKWINWIIIPV